MDSKHKHEMIWAIQYEMHFYKRRLILICLHRWSSSSNTETLQVLLHYTVAPSNSQLGLTHCSTYVAPHICDTLFTVYMQHIPDDVYLGYHEGRQLWIWQLFFRRCQHETIWIYIYKRNLPVIYIYLPCLTCHTCTLVYILHLLREAYREVYASCYEYQHMQGIWSILAM